MRRLVLAASLLALAVPAAAQDSGVQDRGPDDRRRLLDLAQALGDSHALRQACAGPADDYWRARMLRLAEIEGADPAFDAALSERFNTAYEARRAQGGVCGPAGRAAERQAAQRGRALALTLSRALRPAAAESAADAPDSMAALPEAR